MKLCDERRRGIDPFDNMKQSMNTDHKENDDCH